MVAGAAAGTNSGAKAQSGTVADGAGAGDGAGDGAGTGAGAGAGASAGGELAAHLALMREQQDEAVAFESSERETMRLALTEIILEREATIADLCVLLTDKRAQANMASSASATIGI